MRDQALEPNDRESIIDRLRPRYTGERLLDAIDSPTVKSNAAARLRAYRAKEDRD